MAYLHQALTVVSLPETMILNLRGFRHTSSTGIGVIAKLLVDSRVPAVVLEVANLRDSVGAILTIS